jgi:hypothetical protein
LAFGDMQENGKLKYRNNIKALSQNYEKWLLETSGLYVCRFVRIEQLGSHWTDYREIWYFSICWKSDQKIKFSIKSDKNYG